MIHKCPDDLAYELQSSEVLLFCSWAHFICPLLSCPKRKRTEIHRWGLGLLIGPIRTTAAPLNGQSLFVSSLLKDAYISPSLFMRPMWQQTPGKETLPSQN